MIFNSILPSFKIKSDTQFDFNQIHFIKPISIVGLSLIKPISKKVRRIRDNSKKLTIVKENKKMTLIIPYRSREEHLKVFLPYIKNYLSKQQIDYEIIIVEQTNSNPFNKAKLMNIGAVHARKESEYFVFHDVDLLPENIDYRFCNFTEKLFSEIKKEGDLNYKKYKQTVLGGAVLVPKKIFFDINGYSNNYWQWGREDDDFFIRHLLKGHIPVCDNSGKFIALMHDSSLLKDNHGNVTQDTEILNKNRKLLHKNKKNYSKIKRGLLDQDHNGVSTLNNFSIINRTKEGCTTTLLVELEK